MYRQDADRCGNETICHHACRRNRSLGRNGLLHTPQMLLKDEHWVSLKSEWKPFFYNPVPSIPSPSLPKFTNHARLDNSNDKHGNHAFPTLPYLTSPFLPCGDGYHCLTPRQQTLIRPFLDNIPIFLSETKSFYSTMFILYKYDNAKVFTPIELLQNLSCRYHRL